MTIQTGTETNRKITALSVTGSASGLAIAHVRDISVFTIQTGETPVTGSEAWHQETPFNVTALALSSDGLILASGSDNGDIALWDARTGTILKRFSSEDTFVYDLKFSPKADLLAAARGSGMVDVWNAATGSKEAVLDVTVPESQGMATKVSWSSDQRYLAATSFDGSVSVWRLADHQRIFRQKTGQPSRGEGGGETGAFSVAWSPDNQLLAVGGRDDLITILDTAQGGKTAMTFVDDKYIEKDALAWSPDGHSLVVGGIGPLQIRDIPEGRITQSLSGHDGPVTGVMWSSDGRYIISGGWDGKVLMWRVH